MEMILLNYLFMVCDWNVYGDGGGHLIFNEKLCLRQFYFVNDSYSFLKMLKKVILFDD